MPIYMIYFAQSGEDFVETDIFIDKIRKSSYNMDVQKRKEDKLCCITLENITK